MNKKQEVDDQLVKDVFQAYFDARTHKRNTINQLSFEVDFEHRLFKLVSDIQNRTYKIGRSICFIVNNPVKREVFAADFSDRVVHHLIFNWVNDIFESKLIRDCYSCRVGLGTSYGIDRLQHHMRSVTNNHTEEAYVLKLDIQGYFMSINRNLLHEKVKKVIIEEKRRNPNRKFLDEALYLLNIVIHDDPTYNCWIKSDMREWNGLPPSKSLFHSATGCGLPIGNLTSQMFSNIYLSEFDNYVKRDLKMKHYGRYVDDFYFMHRDKQVLIEVRDKVTEYLKEKYNLVVHPNKIYLQNVNHGVTFLGANIKPHRTYIRTRTLGMMRNNLRRIDRRIAAWEGVPDNNTLYIWRSTFNSYLGHLSQFKSYGIRKELWDDSVGFKRYFYCHHPYMKVQLRREYCSQMPTYKDDSDLDFLYEECEVIIG